MECFSNNNSLSTNSITLNKTKDITLIKGWRKKKFDIGNSTEDTVKSKTYSFLSDDLRNCDYGETLIEENAIELEKQLSLLPNEHYKKIGEDMKNNINSEIISRLSEKLSTNYEEELNEKSSPNKVNNDFQNRENANYGGNKSLVSNQDKMIRECSKKQLNEFYSETIKEFVSRDSSTLNPISNFLLQSLQRDKSERQTRADSESDSASSCGSGYIYVPRVPVRTSNVVTISDEIFDKFGGKPKTLYAKRRLYEALQNENRPVEENCSYKHVQYVDRKKKFDSTFRLKNAGRMLKSKFINLASSSNDNTINKKNCKASRLLTNRKIHLSNKLRGSKLGIKNGRINKKIPKKISKKRLKIDAKNVKSILNNPVYELEKPLVRRLPIKLEKSLRMKCKDINVLDNYNKNRKGVMVLHLGLGRPLYQEQVNNINLLRKNDCVIDAAYARFSVSAVLNKKDPKKVSLFVVPVVCPIIISLMNLSSSQKSRRFCSNTVSQSNTKSLGQKKCLQFNKVKNRKKVEENHNDRSKLKNFKDKLSTEVLSAAQNSATSVSDVKKRKLHPKRLFKFSNIDSKKSINSSNEMDSVSQVIDDVVSNSSSLHDSYIHEVISEVTAQSQVNDYVNNDNVSKQNVKHDNDYSNVSDISSQKSISRSSTSDLNDKTNECERFSTSSPISDNSLTKKHYLGSISNEIAKNDTVLQETQTDSDVNESSTIRKLISQNKAVNKFVSVRYGSPSRKVALELRRLNSHFVEFNENDKTTDSVTNEDASTGTIRKTVSNIKVSQENITDLIPDDITSKLAKAEKDYHQTVMRSNNELIFLSSYSERNKRIKRLPKKFQDAVLLDDSEVLKPCKDAKKEQYKLLDMDEIDKIVKQRQLKSKPSSCNINGNQTKPDTIMSESKSDISVDDVKSSESSCNQNINAKNVRKKESDFSTNDLSSAVGSNSDAVSVTGNRVLADIGENLSENNLKFEAKLATESVASKTEKDLLSLSNSVKKPGGAHETMLDVSKMKVRVPRELKYITEMNQENKLVKIDSGNGKRTLRSAVKGNRRSNNLWNLRNRDELNKSRVTNSSENKISNKDDIKELHLISVGKSDSIDKVGNINQNSSRSSDDVTDSSVSENKKLKGDKITNFCNDLVSGLSQELISKIESHSDKSLDSVKYVENLRNQNIKDNTVLVETSHSILKPSYLRNNRINCHDIIKNNNKLLDPRFNPYIKIERIKWCVEHRQQNCQKCSLLGRNVAKKRTFPSSYYSSRCVKKVSKLNSLNCEYAILQVTPKVLCRTNNSSGAVNHFQDKNFAKFSQRCCTPKINKNLIENKTGQIKTNRNCNPLDDIEFEHTIDCNDKSGELITNEVEQFNQLPRIESVMTIRPEEFFAAGQGSVKNYLNSYKDVSEKSDNKPSRPVEGKEILPYNNNSYRFFCIYLKFKFAYVKFTGTPNPNRDVCIPYASMMEFINRAQSENRCVHRPLKKLHNEAAFTNPDMSFGIYVVPSSKYVIYFGPYGINEGHQLEAYVKLTKGKVDPKFLFSPAASKPVPFVTPSLTAVKEIYGVQGRWWYVDSKRAGSESIASVLNGVTFQNCYHPESFAKTDEVNSNLNPRQKAFIPLTPSNSSLIQNQINLNIINSKINPNYTILDNNPEYSRSISNVNNGSVVNHPAVASSKTVESVPRKLNSVPGAVQTVSSKTGNIGPVISNSNNVVQDRGTNGDENAVVTDESPTAAPKCLTLTQCVSSGHKTDADSSKNLPVLCSNIESAVKEDCVLLGKDKNGLMKIRLNVLSGMNYILPTVLRRLDDSKDNSNLIYVFNQTTVNSTVNTTNGGLLTSAGSGMNTNVVNSLNVSNNYDNFPLTADKSKSVPTTTCSKPIQDIMPPVDSIFSRLNTAVTTPPKASPSKVIKRVNDYIETQKSKHKIKKVTNILDNMKSRELFEKSVKRKRSLLEAKLKKTKKRKLTPSIIDLSEDSPSDNVNLEINHEENLTLSLSPSNSLVSEPILSEEKSGVRIQSNVNKDKDIINSKKLPLSVSPSLINRSSSLEVVSVHGDNVNSLSAKKCDQASALPKVTTAVSAPPVLLSPPVTGNLPSFIEVDPARPTGVKLVSNPELLESYGIHFTNDV